MLSRKETLSFSSHTSQRKGVMAAQAPVQPSQEYDKSMQNEQFYPLASFSTLPTSKDSSGALASALTSSPPGSPLKSTTIMFQEDFTETEGNILNNLLYPYGIKRFTYIASLRENLWQNLLHCVSYRNKRKVRNILECLSIIEKFWGRKGMEKLKVIEQVCLIQRWEKAAELITARLEQLPLGYHGDSPEFYVLVVQPHHFSTNVRSIANVAAELEFLCERGESFSGEKALVDLQYSIVEVNSARDALLAVLINPDILAVVVCENVPTVQSAQSENENKNSYADELMDQFLLGIENFIEVPVKRLLRGVDVVGGLIESLNACRSELNIYTISSNSGVVAADVLRSLVVRSFASLEDHSELHDTIINSVRERRKAPFFENLKAYAERPIGVFHALAISRGNSIRHSRWIQNLGKFYGINLFKAESSATCGGLDSLLDPHGALKDAQFLASRTFGAQFLFFTTNGTSTSNKIVSQALTRPGGVILVDRACHKSHHYSFVLQGVRPCYLDPYPLQNYSMYGGVPLETIKQTLLAYKEAGRLEEIQLLTLTNCTFDGITYNVQRLMEECLAIKPDLCFLFDEAWFAYAFFHPIFKCRTAMNAANVIRQRLSTGCYDMPYKALCTRLNVEDLDEVKDVSLLIKERLYPNPNKAVIRVYATQSTHKSLTALRQGSMILCNDDYFESRVHTAFKEAYYTHMSTSPNYQILATMDMGRVQMNLEGYKLVQKQIEAALHIRFLVNDSAAFSSCFHFLSPKEMIPSEYSSNISALLENHDGQYDLQLLEKTWLSEDFFVLDPTRLTLYVGATGLDGETFKVDWLMNKYGIQVNKTSRNSVLFQTNIGTDQSSCLYLVQCLERAVEELDAMNRLRSQRENELIQRSITSLSIHCPTLPSFNHFHKSYAAQAKEGYKMDSFLVRDGDIRTPYYLAYDDNNCEYYEVHEAYKKILKGGELVSSTFLIPYPPGFPIAVPGQLLTADILDFMIKLDVKEIHGYDAQLGLRCLKPSILSQSNASFTQTSIPPKPMESINNIEKEE